LGNAVVQAVAVIVLAVPDVAHQLLHRDRDRRGLVVLDDGDADEGVAFENLAGQLLVDTVVGVDAIVGAAVGGGFGHKVGDMDALIHLLFGGREQRGPGPAHGLFGAADVKGELPVVEGIVNAGDLGGAGLFAELNDFA